jgi:uridine kinase
MANALSLDNPSTLRELIADRVPAFSRPLVVAFDGRSGAGKSTLAAALAGTLNACVIEGDDFYAGGTGLRGDGPEARACACIDWTRQRPVLEALRGGRAAGWRAFDWKAFDGRPCDSPTVRAPKPVVILEGVYSARPELTDLVDLKVFVEANDEVRMARLLAREGEISLWERQWHEAEEHYFARTILRADFDVVLSVAV